MKFVIVVLFVFFVLTLQRPTDKESANAKILKFKNVRYPTGEYQFEFETSDGTMRREKAVLLTAKDGTEYLAVEGFYSYRLPDGKIAKVYYTADDKGFSVLPHSSPFGIEEENISIIDYRFDETLIGSLVQGGIKK